MFFLIRAAFWIGVVALFLPSNPAASAVAGHERAAMQVASDVTKHGKYQAVVEVCSANADLCSAGVQAVDQTQDLAVQGLTALAAVIEEDKTPKN